MTEKDLIGVVSLYFKLMEFNENNLAKPVNKDAILSNHFRGELAYGCFLQVAKGMKESSQIWVLVGSSNLPNVDGNIERIYAFKDLETEVVNIVSEFDYGDFCRENSVIIMNDNMFEEFGLSNEEKFQKLRERFFRDLSKCFQHTELNMFEHYCKWLPISYANIVKQYKALGVNSLKLSNRSK